MRTDRVPLYALVGVYMPALSFLAWRQGNQEFLFYALAMVAIIAGVWAIDRRVRFSTGVLWLLALWGLAHMAGGTVPSPSGEEGRVLYSWRPVAWLPKYDQVVHAYGFFAATFACAECVRAARGGGRARIGAGLAIGVALMGMGLGAVNEVLEFAATRLFAETGVGGYVNTGWDLVANTLGAGAAGVIIYAREKGGGSPAARSD